MPAVTNTIRISSVAYALEDIASDEKTASALTLVRRSSFSASVGSRLPTANSLIPRYSRPNAPWGRETSSVARKYPGETRRSKCESERTMRTYVSPRALPCSSSCELRSGWISGSEPIRPAGCESGDCFLLLSFVVVSWSGNTCSQATSQRRTLALDFG